MATIMMANLLTTNAMVHPPANLAMSTLILLFLQRALRMTILLNVCIIVLLHFLLTWFTNNIENLSVVSYKTGEKYVGTLANTLQFEDGVPNVSSFPLCLPTVLRNGIVCALVFFFAFSFNKLLFHRVKCTFPTITSTMAVG